MPRSKNTPRVGAVADDGGPGAAFRCIAAAAAAGGSMICATGVALASNAGRGDVLGRILAPLPRGPPVGPLAGDGAAWGRGRGCGMSRSDHCGNRAPSDAPRRPMNGINVPLDAPQGSLYGGSAGAPAGMRSGRQRCRLLALPRSLGRRPPARSICNAPASHGHPDAMSFLPAEGGRACGGGGGGGDAPL